MKEYTSSSSLVLATAVCGAVGFVGADHADAAVVSTPGISLSSSLAIPDNVDGLYLNVVTGAAGTGPVAGWDLNPYSATAGNLNWWGPAATTWLLPSGATGGDIALTLGTVVGSGGTYTRPGGGSPATAGASTGQFTLNAVNYVGFQFVNEGTSATHYGYLAIQLGSTFADRSIVGSFYEDQPGQSITVQAVPEPSTSLLAAGAVGLAALRRRRRAA